MYAKDNQWRMSRQTVLPNIKVYCMKELPRKRKKNKEERDSDSNS